MVSLSPSAVLLRDTCLTHFLFLLATFPLPAFHNDRPNLPINQSLRIYRCIQLYLCGVSTDRARRILYHRKYQETKASGVPGTRYFLIAALFMNFAYTIVTIWDIVVWVTDQDRTDAGVNGLKTPDLVGPFMGGLVG